MTPLIALEELNRRDPNKNLRTVYLLYEGANTEVSLINPLLAHSAFFAKSPVIFRRLDKTEREWGVTNPIGLITIAKDYIAKHCGPRGDFRSGRDKILIVFDLDVLKNDQTKIDALHQEKTGDIILAFTNPAIELFLLLSQKNSYEQIIEPNKERILKNDYFDPTAEEKERFILHLVKEHLGIDPKVHDADFRFILNNVEVAAQQENMYLNHNLSKSAGKLTSNIAYVLLKIRDGKIDEIEE